MNYTKNACFVIFCLLSIFLFIFFYHFKRNLYTGSVFYDVTNKNLQNIERMTDVWSGQHRKIVGEDASARSTSKVTKAEDEQNNPISRTAWKQPTDGFRTTQQCSQESRVSFYKFVCSNHDAQDPQQKVSYAILDNETKTFGCLISKAGSTSWVSFAVRTKLPDLPDRNYRNTTLMNSVGLDVRRAVPVASVKDQYHDFTNYIVVRHPLQRVVSAYYFAIIFLGHCKKTDNTTLTFVEFIEGVVSGELKGPQWSRYTGRCQICDVDYQFIVKQETLEQDTEDFKKSFGIETDPPMFWRNNNRVKNATINETDSRYKYDKMLADLQDKKPVLMRRLLKAYEWDMKLFGYGWDWNNRKSYCNAYGCC